MIWTSKTSWLVPACKVFTFIVSEKIAKLKILPSRTISRPNTDHCIDAHILCAAYPDYAGLLRTHYGSTLLSKLSVNRQELKKLNPTDI